jgi:hypothetical protein
MIFSFLMLHGVLISTLEIYFLVTFVSASSRTPLFTYHDLYFLCFMDLSITSVVIIIFVYVVDLGSIIVLMPA